MKDKFTKFSLPLLWVFAFIIIIFLITLTAKAAGNPYFPMTQNNGNIVSETGKNTISTTLNSDDYYIFILYRDVYSSRQRFYYVKFPKNQDGRIYGEISNNGYQFSLYTVGGSGRFYIAGGLQLKSDGTLYNYTENFDNLSYFQNLVSSNYDGAKSYMSNFWLYNNNTDSKIALLQYGPDPDAPVEPDIQQGHATPPDSYDNPTLATGSNHTLPREVPESPTINNYSWTVYNSPTIDTTNIESLLESLIYVINYLAGWLKDNLAGEFANLIANIQAFIQFIVDTIQYYGGLIISNIQNGIDTFYNNMVSLFEPISSAINYVITPIDSDVINDSLESTNFYSIKTQFTSAFTTFDNAFDIAEPDSFTIIFNVQNITLFYNFGVRSPVTVDLGSNFLPIRAALRTFLWVLVSFGSVFVVEHGLANWLRGERNT